MSDSSLGDDVHDMKNTCFGEKSLWNEQNMQN